MKFIGNAVLCAGILGGVCLSANAVEYVTGRYVEGQLLRLVEGKDYACQKAAEEIKGFDNAFGRTVFSIGKRGHEGYFNANCR